jgi:hypothetical protein
MRQFNLPIYTLPDSFPRSICRGNSTYYDQVLEMKKIQRKEQGETLQTNANYLSNFEPKVMI